MGIRSERGAVLIFAAIAIFGLVAFTAVVVDYGVLWAARGGAQNAADAGALAGAGSLARMQGNTHASQTAMAFTQANRIFDSPATAPNITVTVPYACPFPYAATPPNMACVRVDLQRQNVPTFFSRRVGIQSQGTKATATAIAGQGNSTECIKPWIVADKWVDNSSTGSNTSGWDQEDIYNPGVDTYSPPGFKATGPGNDYGMQLSLKGDRNQWSGGWSLEIELGGGNGSNTYRDEIGGCPSWVPTVGLWNPANPCTSRNDTNPEQGCVNVRTGVRQGPTEQGVAILTNRDPNARWDPSTKTVINSCITNGSCTNPTGADVSPRIAPIAIFDTTAYATSGCSGNNCVARVVNIIGFFVEGMCDDLFPKNGTPAWCGTHPKEVVVGRLINYPAQSNGIAGAPGPASFITTVKLVR